MTKNFEKIKQETELRKQMFYDPTLDPVFKKIFDNKSTLINFLNAFLRLENDRRITEVEQIRRTVKLKKAGGGDSIGRFDIHARTADGRFVNIEMQRIDHDDFLDRIELYSSLLTINAKITMDSEVSKDQFKEHPYLMPTVYSIWLCNFEVPFCNGYREDLGLFRYSDLGDKRALPIYAKKRYIVIDITRFVPAKGNELEQQWLEIFKNAPNARRIPANVADEIRDVYERLLVKNSTRDFLKKVVGSMTDKREYWAGLATARRRAEAEGFAKGEAKGLAKGLAKGEKKSAKMVKFLQKNGVSPKLLAAALALK